MLDVPGFLDGGVEKGRCGGIEGFDETKVSKVLPRSEMNYRFANLEEDFCGKSGDVFVHHNAA